MSGIDDKMNQAQKRHDNALPLDLEDYFFNVIDDLTFSRIVDPLGGGSDAVAAIKSVYRDTDELTEDTLHQYLFDSMKKSISVEIDEDGDLRTEDIDTFKNDFDIFVKLCLVDLGDFT